ncbi:MAG TPA: hypothetical protein VFT01_03345 [Homoserinimonas sp.]|nr:hypothetical protein [Homoserinimonas sp.]
MKRSALLVALFTAVITLVLPFVGGSGPSLVNSTSAFAESPAGPIFASEASAAVQVATAAIETGESETPQTEAQIAAALTSDSEHLAQKPVPKPVPKPAISKADAASGTAGRRAAAEAAGFTCPGNIGGSTAGAPGISAGGGMITGTTSGDLASFAGQYNAIRVANCLQPVPMANIRYDSCLEARLIWMAEDPSTDPTSAWGHIGSARSDGVPSVGCDGNLAGGSGDSGASAASKWWNSSSHRNSLYKPSYAGATSGVCVYFAMTHGGVPNEAYSFSRAAARWGGC